ncbi:MAG: hypothetical protein WCY06_02840 [Flavobacteriaceae bacterium]
MSERIRIFCFFAVLLFCSLGHSQEPESQISKDTINPKQKEALQNLEQKAKEKGGFARFTHKLIFRPIRRRSSSNLPDQNSILYKEFEGKIIRNINITTLDPFGFSVSDTLRKPENWGERAGNSLHIKSMNSTIRNLLLFKKNQPLDSLIAQESERLIRSQRYVRRVLVEPIRISETSDSVDINIRVLDSWSLVPTGSISSSRMNFEISERNFLGLGHTFRNDFQQRFDDSENAYGARYIIPNIRNTYINTTFTYDLDVNDNSLKSVEIQRDFFSPLTKWAGGVYFDERFLTDSLPDISGEFALQNFKSRNQEYWGGRAFNLSGFNEEADRTLNLVTTLGFYSTAFSEKPSIEYDSIGFFSNNRTYLMSIGITSRRFVKDRYLFEYDRTEDVAIGKVYSITGGFQDKNNLRRMYLGTKYSFGNYYDFGFFGSDFEVGTFFNNGKTEQGIIRARAIYFTKLRQIGSWYFRQFIKPEIAFGFNRVPIIKDQFTLSGRNGIEGFNSRVLGTQKALLYLQTQSYAPGIWYGFRFSPFLNFTFGAIGEENHSLFKSRLYTKIGLGVLVSNDFLVFNQFQLSVAFYPTIPFEGDNIFKTNTFKNDDFILQNFRIEQPEVIRLE